MAIWPIPYEKAEIFPCKLEPRRHPLGIELRNVCVQSKEVASTQNNGIEVKASLLNSYENGEQNGVLTAVEDFMRESTFNLKLYKLYSNNGLGIIVPEDSSLTPLSLILWIRRAYEITEGRRSPDLQVL